MPAAAVATLVITALLVAALAFYLIWVVVILRSVNGTLNNVVSAVRAIADRTAPLEPVLTDVNNDLAAVADAVENLAAKVKPPAKAS